MSSSEHSKAKKFKKKSKKDHQNTFQPKESKKNVSAAEVTVVWDNLDQTLWPAARQRMMDIFSTYSVAGFFDGSLHEEFHPPEPIFSWALAAKVGSTGRINIIQPDILIEIEKAKPVSECGVLNDVNVYFDRLREFRSGYKIWQLFKNEHDDKHQLAKELLVAMVSDKAYDLIRQQIELDDVGGAFRKLDRLNLPRDGGDATLLIYTQDLAHLRKKRKEPMRDFLTRFDLLMKSFADMTLPKSDNERITHLKLALSHDPNKDAYFTRIREVTREGGNWAEIETELLSAERDAVVHKRITADNTAEENADDKEKGDTQKSDDVIAVPAVASEAGKQAGGERDEKKSGGEKSDSAEASASLSTRPKLNISDVKCYGCQQKGHFARDCPNKNETANIASCAREKCSYTLGTLWEEEQEHECNLCMIEGDDNVEGSDADGSEDVSSSGDEARPVAIESQGQSSEMLLLSPTAQEVVHCELIQTDVQERRHIMLRRSQTVLARMLASTFALPLRCSLDAEGSGTQMLMGVHNESIRSLTQAYVDQLTQDVYEEVKHEPKLIQDVENTGISPELDNLLASMHSTNTSFSFSTAHVPDIDTNEFPAIEDGTELHDLSMISSDELSSDDSEDTRDSEELSLHTLAERTPQLDTIVTADYTVNDVLIPEDRIPPDKYVSFMPDTRFTSMHVASRSRRTSHALVTATSDANPHQHRLYQLDYEPTMAICDEESGITGFETASASIADHTTGPACYWPESKEEDPDHLIESKDDVCMIITLGDETCDITDSVFGNSKCYVTEEPPLTRDITVLCSTTTSSSEYIENCIPQPYPTHDSDTTMHSGSSIDDRGAVHAAEMADDPIETVDATEQHRHKKDSWSMGRPGSTDGMNSLQILHGRSGHVLKDIILQTVGCDAVRGAGYVHSQLKQHDVGLCNACVCDKLRRDTVLCETNTEKTALKPFDEILMDSVSLQCITVSGNKCWNTGVDNATGFMFCRFTKDKGNQTGYIQIMHDQLVSKCGQLITARNMSLRAANVDNTAHELVTDTKPDITLLRPLSAYCYIHRDKDERIGKDAYWQERAVYKDIVGYADMCEGVYKVLVPLKNIQQQRHVLVQESSDDMLIEPMQVDGFDDIETEESDSESCTESIDDHDARELRSKLSESDETETSEDTEPLPQRRSVRQPIPNRYYFKTSDLTDVQTDSADMLLRTDKVQWQTVMGKEIERHHECEYASDERKVLSEMNHGRNEMLYENND